MKSMKTTYSMMFIALLMVFALALPAVAQTPRKGPGSSNIKDDKPQPPEPVQTVALECKLSFQSKNKPAQVSEPTTWRYHAEIINTTGKPVPKGTKIDYRFTSKTKGYFWTNQGSVLAITKTLVLPAALPINDDWFLGNVVYKSVAEPVINCSASYKKTK